MMMCVLCVQMSYIFYDDLCFLSMYYSLYSSTYSISKFIRFKTSKKHNSYKQTLQTNKPECIELRSAVTNSEVRRQTAHVKQNI